MDAITEGLGIPEGSAFTVVVEFEVAPDRQGALLSGLSVEARRHFSTRPGFISATLHASHDGRRVLNYARWTSEAAYGRFRDSPGDGPSRVHALVAELGASIVSSRTYVASRVID
jgi:hypothetical protein